MNELISLIENDDRNLYLLIHPERWRGSFIGWLLSFISDFVINYTKVFIKIIKKMKIILVMSEAFLWKPKFVNDIINSLAVENKIVGVVLSSFKPRKTSSIKHITRYFIMLGPKAFFITAFKSILWIS